MAVIRIGESAMQWKFRSCGSFQESSFMILQPPTNPSTLIRSGATLAATLDLVSHDLISLYSSHLTVNLLINVLPDKVPL